MGNIEVLHWAALSNVQHWQFNKWYVEWAQNCVWVKNLTWPCVQVIFLSQRSGFPNFEYYSNDNIVLLVCVFLGLLVKCSRFGVDTLLKTHCLPCCWIHPQPHLCPPSPTDACEISCRVINGRNTGGNTTKSGKEKGLKDWIKPQVGDNPKTFCGFCKRETPAHHKGITSVTRSLTLLKQSIKQSSNHCMHFQRTPEGYWRGSVLFCDWQKQTKLCLPLWDWFTHFRKKSPASQVGVPLHAAVWARQFAWA